MQLLRCRARDDRERHLRPDSRDREQLHEQLPLGSVGEPVQLQGVLAHVQVRLQGDFLAALGLSESPLGRMKEVADAPHVEDDALGAPRCHFPTKGRDHRAITSSKGGASA